MSVTVMYVNDRQLAGITPGHHLRSVPDSYRGYDVFRADIQFPAFQTVGTVVAFLELKDT